MTASSAAYFAPLVLCVSADTQPDSYPTVMCHVLLVKKLKLIVHVLVNVIINQDRIET